MSPEFRSSGIAGAIGPQSAPIVNISDSRNSNLNLGIMALLTMQFFFLMLISWKLLFSGPGSDQLTEVTEKMDALIERKSYAEKLEVMELALKAAGDGKAELAKAIEDKLELAKRAEDARVNRDVMRKAKINAESKANKSKTDLKNAETELKANNEEIKELKAEVKSLKESEGAVPFYKSNAAITIFIVGVVITGIGAGIAGFLFGRFREEDEDEVYEREREPISRASNKTDSSAKETEIESSAGSEPFEIRDDDRKDSRDKRE